MKSSVFSSLTFSLLLVFTVCFQCSFPKMLIAQENIPFFIGTYTGGTSEGIYRSSLQVTDGKMTAPQLVARLQNPSFLAVHPKLNVLYAVSEVAIGDHQIVAYKIEDQSLVEFSHASSEGGSPCFISTDSEGKFALVANYGGGSVTSLALKADGSFSGQKTIRHSGSSIHPRQKGPHGHCILPDPSNQFACAVDLGLDEVLVYSIDQSLQLLGEVHSKLKVTPGSGPRHIAFHPDGKHAFVIHELTCKISVCTWDSETGILKETQTLSTLPGKLEDGYSTAEILVHPSGKFVYGSNRGHHSIAGFRFDGEKLAAISHTPTGGETPRNFRIDPSGKILLAENQGTDSIVSFHIDSESGKLSATGNQIQVGSPVCIKFYPQK